MDLKGCSACSEDGIADVILQHCKYSYLICYDFLSLAQCHHLKCIVLWHYFWLSFIARMFMCVVSPFVSLYVMIGFIFAWIFSNSEGSVCFSNCCIHNTRTTNSFRKVASLLAYYHARMLLRRRGWLFWNLLFSL